MNAIDILGSLLGGGRSGSKGGGGVTDILSEILGGQAAPASAPQGNPRGHRSTDSPMSPEQLEEMLGVGRDSASARQAPSQPQSRQSQPREMPRATQQPPSSQLPTDIFGQRQRQEPKINLSVPKPAPLSQREEADYLRQLAKALRISPEQCNQIHQQQNTPLMYQA